MRSILPLVLAACAPLSPTPPPLDLSRTTPAEVALTPPAAALAVSMSAAPEPTGWYRTFTGPTFCAAEDGRQMPFLACWGVPPRVGLEWEMVAWTRAQPAPDTEFAWMIVAWSQLPQPIDFTGAGMPGCWLLVPLEAIVPIPVGSAGLWTRSPASPGRIALRWTPGLDALGKTVSFQLLVADPLANRLGLLAGAALTARIGL